MNSRVKVGVLVRHTHPSKLVLYLIVVRRCLRLNTWKDLNDKLVTLNALIPKKIVINEAHDTSVAFCLYLDHHKV